MDEQKLKRKARAVIRALRRRFPNAGIALKYENPWELMVAVQLSAQCTDKKVNEVTGKLFRKYRTLDDYVHADQRVFERDIHSTGFYRNKTKHILAAAKMVKEEFGGRLPRTMAELLRLPGVGRKTANVVLGNVYDVTDGIAVDTHVRRLSRRLGLTPHSDPDKIEADLMRIVPKKDWSTFTYLLIDYGRASCTAKRHDHGKCLLRKYE